MHKRKLNSLDDYEQRIGLLRDDFSYLNTEKSMLQDRYAKVTPGVYRIYVTWLCFGLYQVDQESFSKFLVQTQPLLQQ